MMERLTAILTESKLPVGRTARQVFDWLKLHAEPVFGAIADGLGALVDAIHAVLVFPHPLVFTAVAAALALLLRRGVAVAAGVAAGFLFILNQGYWKPTMESLSLVLAAGVVCMALGVPAGIALAHRPRLYRLARPLLDLMQTLPSFVYLIPAIVFFGIGTVPGLVATVIFVLPAPIRLTRLGIASTPLPLVEAARAFGATPRQLLWKVELPSAASQILAGLNQTIMLSLSMVVIAALVGAAGLGVPVVRALNSVNTALGFESGIVIVVVAIILDRLLAAPRREK